MQELIKLQKKLLNLQIEQLEMINNPLLEVSLNKADAEKHCKIDVSDNKT